MTATQRIRLLCVGLGGMGLHDWLSAAKVPEFELVAGVDVTDKDRALFEEKTALPSYEDYDQALGTVEADAALIATPDAFHAPFTIKALEAGLDVICEKPMAETLDDAHRMHDAAEKNGRMLMIHHQLRWLPFCRRIRQAVDDGEIGILRSVEFRMFVHADSCLTGYRSKLKHLVIRDLAVHHFDLMRYLTAREVESIYALSWPSNEEGHNITVSTNVFAILRMTGPVEVNYRSSTRSITEQTGYGAAVELTGSKGCIGVNGDNVVLQTHEGFADKEPRELLALTEPEHCEPWQSFANAMITRKPTLTSSADNLKSLEVVFAAIESADTGKAVRCEPDALRRMPCCG